MINNNKKRHQAPPPYIVISLTNFIKKCANTCPLPVIPGDDLGGDVVDEGGEVVGELVREASLARRLVGPAPVQVLHHRLDHQLEQRPVGNCMTVTYGIRIH